MPAEIPAFRVPVRLLLALAVGALVPLAPAATPILTADALPSGATLTIVADPVEVAHDGVTTFAAAVDGQSLRAGDIVHTGGLGVALLTFFNGSETQLGSDSVLQIEQADYDPTPQIALYQTSGVSVNRVIPLPTGGSFRTDTADATGLVRGTTYVATVAPASDSMPSSTSMALLTDRDGHVGHVQVVPIQDGPMLDLTSAGDAGNVSGHDAIASQIDNESRARLEGAAQDFHRVGAAGTAADQARRVLQALASGGQPTPAQPATAAEPGTPATPAQPATAAQPGTPPTPAQPATPATPAKTAQSTASKSAPAPSAPTTPPATRH